MKWSRLRNKENMTKDTIDSRNYKGTRWSCCNLNKKVKLEYFSIYDSNHNKQFWKKWDSFLKTKHNKVDTDIMSSENRDVIL